MWTLALLQASWLLVYCTQGQLLYCRRGYRVHTPVTGPDVCVLCRDGVTFTSEAIHTHRKCHDCTKVDNPDREMVVAACNRTHDTEILCRAGYYRYKARNVREKDRCDKCSECEHPAKPCEGYHDTVCCFPNHDAVLTSGGRFVCKERPVVCGPGQFLEKTSEECLPCPASTFMPSHTHNHTKCRDCKVLSGDPTNHAVIGRPCSSSSATLFSCEPGYFRDPFKESLEVEVPCSPCRRCVTVLKPCGLFNDVTCANLAPTIVLNGLLSAGSATKEEDETFLVKDNSTRGKLNTDKPCLLQPSGNLSESSIIVDNQTEVNIESLNCILLLVAILVYQLGLLLICWILFDTRVVVGHTSTSHGKTTLDPEVVDRAPTSHGQTTLTRTLKHRYQVHVLANIIMVVVHITSIIITMALLLSVRDYQFRHVTSFIYLATSVIVTVVHTAIIVLARHRLLITCPHHLVLSTGPSKIPDNTAIMVEISLLENVPDEKDNVVKMFIDHVKYQE